MQVKDLMTKDPVCCTATTPLAEVAKLMADHDVGAIPLVDDPQQRRPLGMVTDRDICCRAVAQGKNPLSMTAGDCASEPGVMVTDETSLQQCSEKMQQTQVRRMIVVDASGQCCGIVAQADLANADPQTAGQTVKDISQPTPSASAVR